MSTSSKTSDHDFIPLCAPEIRGNEWKYIKDCLDSGWVSSVGSYVGMFENKMAKRIGTRQAVAVVNGTSAIHIALLVSGVQPDEEVITSALTFISPANAIRYAKAWPVFIDADPVYWQLDIQKLADFLKLECTWTNGELHNKSTKRRVRAILPVHILGHTVDMEPLIALARKFNLLVIEDATECLGAFYRDRPSGSIGDIACFSFNGNKIITTGGGGMIVTDNSEWADHAKHLTTQAKDDPLEYIHDEIGYNYRLTNFQAAMGCAQMEVLEEYITAKRRIADSYRASLANIRGITPMQQAEWCKSIWWMFTVLVDAVVYKEESRALLKRLEHENIQTRPLWQPMHLSPAHKQCQAYHCDVAARLYRDALSLPCSVGLSEAAQQRVLMALAREC